MTRITHSTTNSELTHYIRAVLFVLNKFMVVHERERCEGLRRGWLSVYRNMSIVFQPSRPDTGFPLFEERVIAVRVESDLLFESYLRVK